MSQPSRPGLSTGPSSQSQSFSAPADPPPIYDARPLPAGWIKEFDPKTGRNFYVDTLAEPHRSIWVHPLDDPEFIRLHRTYEDELDSDDDQPLQAAPGKLRKEYPQDEKNQHHEDDRLSVPSTERAGSSRSSDRRTESLNDAKLKKRGFFGRLKDKAIGTKEEREAARKAREARYREQERLYYEHRDAMLARRMQQMEQERAAYERAGTYRNNGGYNAPQMNAYGGPTYQDPYAYGQSPYNYNRGNSGFGGGGAALTGLIGGLLLGDLLF